MPASIPFYFVDVFAAEPLTGNPLALVPDADGIDEATMRSIAAEFNQSETTFIVAPTDARATWRLRSFTPRGIEVFGAGHNAMGAWIWLAESGRLREDEEVFAQQIGDDILPVRVTRHSYSASVVTMDQSPPVFGGGVSDRRALGEALGLGVDDLAPDGLAQVVSTGAGHLLVEVRHRGIVDAVVPQPTLLGVLEAAGGEGCYVFSRDPFDPVGGSIAYARFFNPTVGIVEDPATGTAAGPLVAALVAGGAVEPGAVAIVEQGFVLGRPSHLRIVVDGDSVRLSGSGLIVASGTLRL